MRRTWQAGSAFALDLFSFVYMNLAHGRTPVSRERIVAFLEYLEHCKPLDRAEYFKAEDPPFVLDKAQAHAIWKSPVETGFAENDAARVDLYWCAAGPSAPTVLFLHALMSASDTGYRRWAQRFNEKGWNACFVHLPYHYSRKPKGFWNGQLAISADLTRTAEGLRQGVIELRQLLRALRTAGCKDFGLWASSYGGWMAATLATVEDDFKFIALLEPITNLEHAIYESRACAAIRRQLLAAEIRPEQLRQHFHLSCPMSAQILTPGDRLFLAAGTFDDVALPADIRALHAKLPGSEYAELPQGHVGFELMEAAWAWLGRRKFW